MKIKITNNEFIPELAFVLCYPYVSEEEYWARIKELQSLNIEEIELDGPIKLGSINVVGKGYRGIIVKAYHSGKLYALKIRRVDCEKESLKDEALYNKIANGIDVGPLLFKYSRNFILREFIDGANLVQWLKKSKGDTIKHTLKDMLFQAFKLDMIGLDHGELARPVKHILITKNGKPFIIDFESASLKRRVHNLTSLTQYLFLRDNIVRKRIEEELGKWDRSQLILALRSYKRTPSLRTFRNMLRILRID